MLDDISRLSAADESGFLERLAALPGSYEGPDGLRAEPYGLTGFGEASPLSAALQSWVDAPLVVSGTQFMLASGFDYGELGALKMSLELSDTTDTSDITVVTLWLLMIISTYMMVTICCKIWRSIRQPVIVMFFAYFGIIDVYMFVCAGAWPNNSNWCGIYIQGR